MATAEHCVFGHWRSGKAAVSLAFVGVGVAVASPAVMAAAPRTANPAWGTIAVTPVAQGATAVLERRLPAVQPAGADAIRLSVCGDGSGARLTIRLMSSDAAESGLDAYYVSHDVPIDFTGWKTITLHLSDFNYTSESSPETDATGGVAAASAPLDTIAIAVAAAPSCRIYVGDIVWTTASAAPTDAPLAVIDDFASSSVSWQLAGGYERVRSAEIQLDASGEHAHGGHASLRIDVRSAGAHEHALNAETVTAHLQHTPQRPYLVSARAPFEGMSSQSTPAASDLHQPPALNVFACPGEIECASFSVFSAKELADVKVTNTALRAGGHEIPASGVDLYVVRQGENADAPEILMKDDRESLSGDLPTVRLTGNPTTDIGAGTSKQFWVDVHVPRNVAPGLYHGSLQFDAHGVEATTIPLTLDVLPITLHTPFLQYGIDLHSGLSSDNAHPDDVIVSHETFAAELADVRDHGFRLVAFHEPLSTLADALKMYKDAGISDRGPVVITTPLHTTDEIQQVEAMRTSLGLSSDFDIYYVLPPDVATDPDSLKSYLRQVRAASRHGLIVAAVTSRAAYDALSPGLDDSTLAPIFASTSDYTITLLSTGKREIQNRDYWSWNIVRQDPEQNRMLAGLLICKTGMKSSPLYGAFPGPYQSTEPAASPDRVTYLVQGGVLDTISWEAVREGIDDVRYYGALKKYDREMKDNRLRPDLTAQTDAFLTSLMQMRLDKLSPEAYQHLRWDIADRAVKLHAILKAKVPDYDE